MRIAAALTLLLIGCSFFSEKKENTLDPPQEPVPTSEVSDKKSHTESELQRENPYSDILSPELLGEALVDAVKTSDVDFLEAIVHPDVSAYYTENGDERLADALHTMANASIDGEYSFSVVDFLDNTYIAENYDSDSQKLTLGSQEKYFPVSPEKFLSVLVTHDDGSTHSRFNEAIAEKNGKWYLIIPDEL